MSAKLEQRIAVLEKQVALLQKGRSTEPAGKGWLDDLYGKFADDPVFERAMKLGQKYRQSLRPKARNAKSKR